MNIIQSWRHVAKMLRPTYGSLFLLVTLKAIKDMYITLLYTYWWLFIFVVMITGLYAGSLHYEWIAYWRYTTRPLLDLIYYSIWLFFIFLVTLIARPSVKRKNYTYITYYKRHYIYFCFFVLLAIGVLGIMREICLALWYCDYKIASYVFYWILWFLSVLFPASIMDFFNWLFIWPISIFFLLFLLDMHPSTYSFIRALKNACLMFLYTYPISILLYYGLVFLCISWLQLPNVIWHSISYHIFLLMGEPLLAWFVHNFVLILLLPIAICFWVTLYFKYAHEQIALYSDESIERES